MAQTLTLTGVSTVGFWGDGGSNNWNTDEDAAILKVALSNPTDPLDHTGHTISFYAEETSGTVILYGTASITWSLRESGTQRASGTYNTTSAGGTCSYTLTTGEAAAIGNYSNLELWVTAVIDAGTDGQRTVTVSVGSPVSVPSAVAPGVPTSVTATDGTYSTKVRVTWTAPASSPGAAAVSYKTYRNTTNNSGSATLKASGVSSPWDDTTAVAGTTYYYWVKSTNPSGDSGFSSSNSGYASGPPAAPTGVAATDGTYTDKARITWNSSVGATSYEVSRALTGSIPASPNWTGITATTYDDTTALNDTVYYYWVKARNSDGLSSASTSDTGYRLEIPPAPANLQATDGSYSDKVFLSWSAAAGADTYRVWRSTTNSFPGGTALQANIAGTTYNDTTAVLDTVYWYWVKAYNTSGLGPESTSNSGYASFGGATATVTAAIADSVASAATVAIPTPNRIYRDLFTTFNPTNSTFHVGVTEMEHNPVAGAGSTSAVQAHHFTLNLDELSLHHFKYDHTFPSCFVATTTFTTSERGGAYMDRPDSIIAGFWSRGSWPTLDRVPPALLYELSMPNTDDIIPNTDGYPYYASGEATEDCWVVFPATDYGMVGVIKTLRRIGFWLIAPPNIDTLTTLEVTVIPHPVNAQGYTTEAITQAVSVTGYTSGTTPWQPTIYAYVDFDPSENPGISGSVSGEAFEIKVKLTNGIGIRRLMVELDLGGDIDTVDSQN